MRFSGKKANPATFFGMLCGTKFDGFTAIHIIKSGYSIVGCSVKKTLAVLALFIASSIPFATMAQEASAQKQPTTDDRLPEGVKEIQKSDCPDVSKLHPLDSEFLVAFGNDAKWVGEGQIADGVKLLWSSSYSKDADSKDVVAMVLYAIGEEDPIAYLWHRDGATVKALVLKNGRIFSTAGAIDFFLMQNDQDLVIGVMVAIMYQGNPVMGREVMLKRENEKSGNKT